VYGVTANAAVMIVILIAATGIEIYPLMVSTVWAANRFGHNLHGVPPNQIALSDHCLLISALVLLASV
jgi:hypothetical protein